VFPPSHEPPEPPLFCPWWCVDRDSPQHPAKHTGHPFGVDAERPADTFPVDLHVLLTRAVSGSVTRITLGIADDDYVRVTTAAGRSLAAVLVRLADVVEGLVSL
jgi:hypothetical protein